MTGCKCVLCPLQQEEDWTCSIIMWKCPKFHRRQCQSRFDHHCHHQSQTCICTSPEPYFQIERWAWHLQESASVSLEVDCKLTHDCEGTLTSRLVLTLWPAHWRFCSCVLVAMKFTLLAPRGSVLSIGWHNDFSTTTTPTQHRIFSHIPIPTCAEGGHFGLRKGGNRSFGI